MTTTLEQIQDDAKKLVAQNAALDSRNRILDSQLTGKKLELRKLEDAIAGAEKRVKSVEADVAEARKEAVAAIDKRNADSERLSKSVAKELSDLSKERRAFEAERGAFEKDRDAILAAEKAVLEKFAAIQSILSA